MSVFPFRLSHRASAWLMAVLLGLAPAVAVAGGPKYVAGASSSIRRWTGQPVHWANGQLNYYVDQGPLNGSVNEPAGQGDGGRGGGPVERDSHGRGDADRQGRIE
jgi:hypothetical protein